MMPSSSNPISYEQSICLTCGSTDLIALIDLGVQPHANDFAVDGTLKFKEPLRLQGCQRCGHAQQAVFVRPDLLFTDYHYASGTSRTLKAYFDEYAAQLRSRFPPSVRVLEVACNDGSFLDSLASHGFEDIAGIDPAQNIAAIAQAQGFHVDVAFFGAKFAEAHTQQYGLIIAQNVLAHTPVPLELLAAMGKLLLPDGEIHVQTSQADMLFLGEFDTVYHEHYSFFGAHSMRALCERAGLVLYRVDFPAIHGGSFRFVIKRAGDAHESVRLRLAVEVSGGLLDGECFRKFSALAYERVRAFQTDIARWRTDGLTVIGVGAAAKAVTFFNFAGVFPDQFVDEAPLKIGKVFPGSLLRVSALESVRHAPSGAVFVIAAWNFFPELMNKISLLRGPGRRDLYVRYLPEMEVRRC